MMIRSAALLLWVLCLLPLAAQARPLVVVSVPALAHVARDIGGPQIDVHQLLQGDASPHDYAMKFSDRRALATAQRIFWVAPSLEAFLAAPLASSAQSVPLFADLPEADAHVWFAPQLMRSSAQRMARHFSELLPEHAALFAARLATFEQQLDTASAELARLLQPLRPIRFIVGHGAYVQLTRAYDLPPAMAVLQQVQTSASARRMAELDRLIAGGGRFCIVEERGHAAAVARQLAQRHGLPRVVIDVQAAYASSYPAWLQQLGRTLAGCAAAMPAH
jgi:zinc transport system substrate-binding protein